MIQLSLAHIAVQIVFCLSILFPIVTSTFWPWWKEPWGWNIVILEVCIGLVLFPAWMNLTFHISIKYNQIWGWIEVVGLYAVACIIVWRIILIYRTQSKGLHREKK